MIELRNQHIEVELDPDHGAEIMSVRRPDGPNALATYDWRSPLRADRSMSHGDGLIDWHSEYRGGWQELFPNAGAACTVAGVPLPFHGEVSRARWRVDAQSEDAVTLSTAARLPLVLERRMRLASDRASLFVEEAIWTDAAMATPFLWGHHPAFTAAAGAHIDMPAGTVVVADADYVADLVDVQPGSSGMWPRLHGRDGRMIDLDTVPKGPLERMAYLTQLGDAPWAAIRNTASGEGVAMAWDGDTFGCAWFWWDIGGPAHPFFGRSRIVAVEPNTTFPADGLAAAHERGQAHVLEAGARHETWLTMSLFEADGRPVEGVHRDGRVVI